MDKKTKVDRSEGQRDLYVDLIKNLRDILPERQLLYSGGFNPKIDNLSNFRANNSLATKWLIILIALAALQTMC